MSNEGYFSFLTIAREWASGSRIPLAMVLRNTCHWALMGGFPAHAFITESGQTLDPFDVLAAAEVATDGSAAPGIQQSALAVLRTVLMSGPAVREFCENTRTVRPRRTLRSVRWLLATITGAKLAPPPCPEAEEEANRQLARRSAVRQMNEHRAILAALRTEPRRERFWGAHAPSLEDRETKWATAKEFIRANIDRSGDLYLRDDLDALDADWVGFFAEQQLRRDAAPSEIVCGSATQENGGDRLHGMDRTAARFRQTDLEPWYRARVADCVARDDIPTRDEDLEAARGALGEGVPRYLVRSLRNSIAPPLWTKRGRRRPAGENSGGADQPA